MDGDYVRTIFRVMLSAITTSQCVNITTVDDTIVEAEEKFLVQVEQIISSDDLTFGLDPEFTEVTILDNDGIYIYPKVIVQIEMMERFSLLTTLEVYCIVASNIMYPW